MPLRADLALTGRACCNGLVRRRTEDLQRPLPVVSAATPGRRRWRMWRISCAASPPAFRREHQQGRARRGSGIACTYHTRFRTCGSNRREHRFYTYALSGCARRPPSSLLYLSRTLSHHACRAPACTPRCGVGILAAWPGLPTAHRRCGDALPKLFALNPPLAASIRLCLTTCAHLTYTRPFALLPLRSSAGVSTLPLPCRAWGGRRTNKKAVLDGGWVLANWLAADGGTGGVPLLST